MGASVVVYDSVLSPTGMASGKYTVHATPAATDVYCGFVPSKVEIVSATDVDTGLMWTKEMANATGMTDAGLAVASQGITPISNSTGEGFTAGTDASVSEASKVFTWRAYR